MAITFDFYRSPASSEQEQEAEPKYHARVVGGQTIGMESLVHHIQQRSTLSKGDIAAVIDELGVELVNELCDGNRIYLPGIGYFSLTLSAPQQANPKQTHNQHIRIKKVEFRADQHLKDQLKEKAAFQRSTNKRHSASISDEKVIKLLREAFHETPYLSRPDFAELCGFTRMTAQRHLDQLIKEGKIVKKGSPRFPIYEPAPDFMKAEEE